MHRPSRPKRTALPATHLLLATTLIVGTALCAPMARADGEEMPSAEALPASAPLSRAGPFDAALPRTAAETARIAAVLAPPTDFTRPEPFEDRPAGAATKMGAKGRDAFSFPSANMGDDARLDFVVGNGLFKKLWVSSPSSTLASDGLGPLFNARGCQSCHVNDGRGHPPEGPGDNGVSMILRLSQASGAPDPLYGGQLQDKAVPGLSAEGQMALRSVPMPVTLADGTVITLRRPQYSVTDIDPPLHPDTRLSPRVAPQMIGLGLLEAISEKDLLRNADPDDRDGDGISGKPNRVWSNALGRTMPGRFGHKAGAPTLRDQAAAAFSNDIGIATSLEPAPWGDCTPRQTRCRTAPNGQSGHAEGLEAPDAVLDLVTFYSRNLAVPDRTGFDQPQVLRGKALFLDTGCAACHIRKFVTQRLPDQPEQSFQLIWPHTDLLLHDMGPGLADDSPEGLANGREWRTAPLWGLGRTRDVSGHQFLLHDGRAASILEAILWHGGEAEPARESVRQMSKADRDALIAYLESL